MAGITLEDVTDNVLQKLKEEVGTPTFWPRDEIQRYALEALREVAETLKIFRRNKILPVEIGKRKYEYPEDFIELNRIEFDGEKIQASSSEELDQLDPKWRTKSGEPEAYYQDQSLPGFFEIFPKPDVDGDVFNLSSLYGVITGITHAGDTFTLSSAYGVVTAITSTDDEWEFSSLYGVITEILTATGNLNVFYSGYPTEPVLETDTLPKPFQKSSRILEDYCMWQALSKEGEAQNLPKASKYEQFWYRDIGQVGGRKDARRRDWRLDSAEIAGRARKHPKLPSDYPDYL